MYKAPGGPLEVWGEHLRVNPGSFSTSFASDDWSQQSADGPTPAQVAAGVTRPRDTTAYSTPPAQDSWQSRIIGTHPSPAQVAAGYPIRNGSFETGSLT